MRKWKCIYIVEGDWSGTAGGPVSYGDIVCVPADCSEIGTERGMWDVVIVEADNPREAAKRVSKMCPWGCPKDIVVGRV